MGERQDLDDADEQLDDLIEAFDRFELTTVGVDIGSSTSHLMFARLELRRLATSLSSRFVVVSRHELFRSPIILTPYRADGLIDVEQLGRFIDRAYVDAGMTRASVDAGAVILTGVALERPNARPIADLFAAEGGRFVCAAAGHNLESLLAAHGSGAVALSRETTAAVLNIDIGGGTTKLALAADGEVVATLAIDVGARVLAFGPDGRIVRLERSALEIGRELGLDVRLGEVLATADRARLVAAMADHIVAAARGTPAGSAHPLHLAGALPESHSAGTVVFSGGVAEFLSGRTSIDSGDLGRDLADAILARRDLLPAPILHADEGIRATVVGASQFTVQVSGSTILVSDEALLPLHNVPVVSVAISRDMRLSRSSVSALITAGLERMDLAVGAEPVALTLRWDRDPHYVDLRAVAEGILDVHRSGARTVTPIVLAFDGDVGESVGRILADDLDWRGGIIAIDGLELLDLDFIDIGELVMPMNVVPVVVKSLVFPTSAGTEVERPRVITG